MVTENEVGEYQRLTALITRWADGDPDVVGAAVVGSWARDSARPASDIDIVVLTTDPAKYVEGNGWVEVAVGQAAPIVRTREWGPLTERRVKLTSGLEVEFGFAQPSWAAGGPVDPGTAGVVRGGCQPLVDPAGLFDRLIAAVG